MNNFGWGGGGWGGSGWSAPYYNNYANAGWYQGGWNQDYFAAGFGPGGFGVATDNFALGLGGWGGLYNSFPTWGSYGLSTWGLGSWANQWMYSGYANPYAATTVVTTPVVVGAAAPIASYDYSQPLDLTTPPEPSAEELATQAFDAARAAFKSGDAAAALGLADRAIAQTANDPALHEFRALCLFALGRYDEAAATLYTMLTAGPGWNWSTMIGLYPNAETYTNQLRALEAKVNSAPGQPGPRFVLAYQYMVQGHGEQARAQFAELVKLQANDQLSARFVDLLTPPEAASVASSQPAQPAPAAPPAAQPEVAATEAEPDGPEVGPPPAELVGTWMATPAEGVSIELTLTDDQAFLWQVTTNGRTQTIEGQAGYLDGTLGLDQEQGAPLAGKIENLQPDGFGFKMLGNGAPTLKFTKS